MNPGRLKMIPKDAAALPVAPPIDADATQRRLAVEAPAGLREGDTGLGYAAHYPRAPRELTEDERRAINLREQQALDAAAERYVADRKRAPGPSPLARAAALLLIPALGLAGLWMFAQLSETLVVIEGWTPWLRYPSYIVFGVCAATLGWSLGGVVFQYCARKRRRQHSLAEIWRAADLGSLKQEQNRLQQAKRSLIDFMEQYALDGEIQTLRLGELGFTDEELQSLRAGRAQLLENERGLPAPEFAAKYQALFQDILDACAERRIKRAAVRVGVKTGVSPSKAVDSMIVLYYGFRMIGDLSRIYNGRADGLSSALLFGSAFFHAYIAGEMEEAFETVADLVMKEGNSVFGRFAELAGSKLAESAANGLILWRLGRATRSLVKPLL